MTAPTIIATWTDDGVFKPIKRFAKVCDANFVCGYDYFVDAVEPRSEKSHRHFFAMLGNIWDSLPDDMVLRFPTKEHLRKYALVRCGYADRQDIACATSEDALRLAAIARTLDQYCVVRVKDNTVAIWRARSQDHSHMDKAQFAESKDRVLSWCATLIGVEPAMVAETKQLTSARDREPGEDDE